MLDGDQRRLRMAYGLMFALPGTPTIFYGEEIGMGENLALDERLAVRTPMQWTAGPTAGFSTAPPDGLCRPLPDDPRFAPAAVNVQAQRTDPDSLLNWFERTIRLRKELPEIGWGECTVLEVGTPEVLALRHEWQARVVVTVHNLAAHAVSAKIAARDVGDGYQLDDLHQPGTPVRRRGDRFSVPMSAYDQRWFRVHQEGTARSPR